MSRYTLEVFSEDTAIIQRDGADILNITVALVGDGVPAPSEAECQSLFTTIAAALGRDDRPAFGSDPSGFTRV